MSSFPETMAAEAGEAEAFPQADGARPILPQAGPWEAEAGSFNLYVNLKKRGEYDYDNYAGNHG